MKELPSVEQVRQALEYNQETGVFRWLVRRNGHSGGVRPGDIAGKIAGAGYRYIGLHGLMHLAHRLAIFYVSGAWPVGDVDHIDGDPTNNAYKNLRVVTHRTNLQNQRAAKLGNRTGFLGVSPTDNGRFRAEITVQTGRINLGRFDSAEEAHAAYLAAKRNLHVGCTI